MASSTITSWQIEGENVEAVTDFIFLGSKITVGSNCSHKIKTCFLLGRIAMTNLDSVLKSRDITLQTKVRLIKAMVFPVIMYTCESWTIKKTERLHFHCSNITFLIKYFLNRELCSLCNLLHIVLKV